MNLKQFPKRLDSKTSCLRITVPENLDLALEGLIRKVLREQPKTDDIYSFAANYFETLLKIRDKAGANFASSQLCPFHNDEDAHEMIKIAGTFTKPETIRKNNEEISKIGKKTVKNQQEKDVRRAKPKKTVREEKFVKHSTPDLIKKLPGLGRAEVKPETIEEKVEIEGEFLTSDPIKELVEKELMMEGKARKETPALETAQVKNQKENKQEEQRADEKVETKPEVSKENPEKSTKNEEEAKTGESVKEEKKEVTPKTKEDTKVLHEPSEEVNKTENAQEATLTPIQVENIDQTKNEQKPRQEKSIESPKDELSPLEVTEKESTKTEVREIKNSDVKEEEKVEKATGGQQPKAKIDKETKATDENIAETSVETPPVGVDSSGANPTTITDTETNNNAETIIKNEQKNEENLKDVQISTKELKKQENNLANVSQREEKTGKDEAVEPERPVETTENRNEKENVSQDDKISLETPEDRAAEVENDRKTMKTNDKIEVEMPPEADQETQKIDEEKPKEVEKAKEEEKLESLESETTQPHETKVQTAELNEVKDSKEADKDDKNHTTAEPVIEDQNIRPTDEQKSTSENKENQTENNTQRKDDSEGKTPEDNQPKVQKATEHEELPAVVDVENVTDKEENVKEEETGKNKQEENPDELCTVVDVDNIPKGDENNTENEAEKGEINENKNDNTNAEDTVAINVPEKAEDEKKEDETKPEEVKNTTDIKNIPEKLENEKKEETAQTIEEKTHREDLSAVESFKNLLEEDKPGEKATENEKKDNESNQEELCTVVDIKNIPDKVEFEKEEETSENKQEENPDELCMVVDVDNIPKGDDNEVNKEETTQNESHNANAEAVDTRNIVENEKKEDEKNVEEFNKVEDTKNTAKEEASNGNIIGNEIQKGETPQKKEKKDSAVEQYTVEEVKEDKIDEKKTETIESERKEDETNAGDLTSVQREDSISENKTEAKLETPETQPPHIIEPESPEVVKPTEEFQIKTIQTHYYDTLQVPETVTKEYIVHNVTTPPIDTLVGVANALRQTINENINSHESVESTTVSLPIEKQQQAELQTQQEMKTTQISDSDDLLDIMTPTSGYSLNLSEISWQTVNGMFLDSERRYSSLEKEEIRYTTPDQNLQEVEEYIQKTVVSTGIDAVPVPPREVEEIKAEETNSENVKEKKPESESDGSSEPRSGDSDVPFISVEVKTVIETQLLEDEEEEKENGRRHPGVEVTVEATIDIQDDVGMPQSDSTEEENKISNGKDDLKSSLEEVQSTNQNEPQKESSSTEQTTGKEGSSAESDTTVSSAPTEIKRTDSTKRNFTSARSLLSTQSLDLGKRNPLMKTRSLSTFRHGVTDFEVWNTIEKELEEAATKIQSKFRGYKTRKKLQRENAVQITTEESSPSTTPAEAEGKEEGQQSTGEFHDSIVLAEHPR